LGQGQDLMIAYGFFLGLTTGLNLLIERKIEKRKTTKEYLVMLIAHLTFLALGTVYASYEFYGNC